MMHLPSSNDAQMVPVLPSGAGEMSQEGRLGWHGDSCHFACPCGPLLMPEVREGSVTTHLLPKKSKLIAFSDQPLPPSA